jgi:hypothetical protein
LSDAFCIERHRDSFNDLIDSGRIDILFANEVEIVSLTQEADFETALQKLASRLPLLVVTRGEHGAIAIQQGERAQVRAEPSRRSSIRPAREICSRRDFSPGSARADRSRRAWPGGDRSRRGDLPLWCAAEADLKSLVAAKLG